MKLKITIQLDEEETEQILSFVRGLLGGISLQTTSNKTESQAIEDSELSDNLEPAGEDLLAEHDCLEAVAFDVIEDEDGIYTVVTCEICGEDVSEEYEETYGDDDCDDDNFDAIRELFGGNGDD
uniref:Uncharacterized protein n=1 Tax=uncultured archaeon MedDCM-OCT-S02-C115 TaxID=743083 RepID=D6PB05_9ARCH|nr:hypothetical protein [uncultured archaeon MedDCM-OCT-S02-C115]